MAGDPLMPEIDFAYAEAPDLHALIDETRSQGPVVPVRFHSQLAYLVTGYEAIREALADEVHFASEAFYRESAAPSMGINMQCMSGEGHRINRGLVSRSFLPSRVKGYVEGPILLEAQRRVDALADQSEVDLVEEFARPFPFSVITHLMGLPIQDEPLFLEWALKLIDFPWDPKGALRAREQFTSYLQPRACSKAIHFHGHDIPAGSPMLFGLTAGNHDASVFEDPHRFDPSRSNKHQHLSFGHGVHFCLGSHLARRELETAIKVLFERFPNMELASEAEIEFTGCVLRGPKEVRVRLNAS
jgi:cytochrome P450